MNTKRNEAVKSDDQCSYHSPQATGHKPPATSHSPLSKWLREPLLHFFILGLVVFGLHGLFEKKPETAADPFLVEVTSADIEWFRTMWSKRMGREPTVEELRGQVNQLIREQVLSREAVSMGLDEGDMVVRRRLVQKMDFLFKDLSDITEPADSDLQKYLEENRSTYEIPRRVTFTHVYFSVDKRGEEEAAEAVRQLVERLNAKEGVSSDVASLGDPFLLQSSYSNKSPAEIRREFGSRFAKAVWEQKPRAWQGPVASGYGLHAVYVRERFDAKLPDFSELKERLKVDWIGEKQREITLRIYEKLLGRYQVLVEGMPYHMDISG
jgi:peptidyl-prolyl cis-trans isomerase C